VSAPVPPSAGPSAFRFLPREDAWNLPFLVRVAEALVTHPAGEAVLVERAGLGAPSLVPSVPSVAAAIRAAAEGLPGTLEALRALPACPQARAPDRFLVVYPARAAAEPQAEGRTMPSCVPGEAGAGRRPARPRPGSLVLEEPERLPAPDPAVSVQLHWWSTGSSELAVRVRLLVADDDAADDGRGSRALAALSGPLLEAGYTLGVRTRRPGWRSRRAWVSGRLPGLVEGGAFRLAPPSAARLGAAAAPAPGLSESVLDRHAVVIGASGSGKTSFLAELARRRIEGGRATVVLDVHGDLGPAVVGGLSEAAALRVLAVDLARPVAEVPGIALFMGAGPDERERESAHVVAALRHLSSEGAETYWGPRLEQVFDVFVRLVAEEGGGFADLLALLTDPNRREAARLATRLEAAAGFLGELPTLLRRHPDYLQPAAARVQRLLLCPKLARLFDPGERPLPVGPWLEGGRSLVLRIPAGEIGPQGSRLAASLLASRIYLLLAASGPGPDGLRVLLVIDEAQSLAPALLAELLAEGRKFGVGAVVATQYAGRLAPEALAAAVGAAGTHVAFRVPRPGAAAAAPWVGLSVPDAERLLPSLPTGVGLVAAPPPHAARRLLTSPPLPAECGPAWEAAVDRTLGVLSIDAAAPPPVGGAEELDERLLLGLLALEEEGAAVRPDGRLRAASGGAGPLAPADLAARLPALVRRGWVEETASGLSLTAAGARRLGLGAPSGAPREGEEHKALLVGAFRILARHGERMEFVRQGRFDARLPDGRLSMLPGGLGALGPREIARAVEARRSTWAWRAFGGRDLHLEAEVSGAERPERIVRGLDKARARGAAVVFLVRDARRARRVRAVLERAGARPPEAQVWAIGRWAAGTRKPKDPAGRSEGPGGPG
jgi:hypothetical protein